MTYFDSGMVQSVSMVGYGGVGYVCGLMYVHACDVCVSATQYDFIARSSALWDLLSSLILMR